MGVPDLSLLWWPLVLGCAVMVVAFLGVPPAAIYGLAWLSESRTGLDPVVVWLYAQIGWIIVIFAAWVVTCIIEKVTQDKILCEIAERK